jgi:hypothetical protein
MTLTMRSARAIGSRARRSVAGAAAAFCMLSSTGLAAPPPPALTWSFHAQPSGLLYVSLVIRCLNSTSTDPEWLKPGVQSKADGVLKGVQRDLKSGRFGFRSAYDNCTTQQRKALLSNTRRLELDEQELG